MKELTHEEYDKLFRWPDTESIISYFDDAVSKALADNFSIKRTERGHWWYGEWKNHCRMVITLFAAKGTSYLIDWGYNYDFIPRMNRQGKFIWHRTEKAVTLHVRDNFFYHVNDDFKKMSERDAVYFAEKYTLPSYANNLAAALEYIDGVVKRNMPFMLEWFDRIRTVEDVIEELNRQIVAGKGDDFMDDFRYWTKAFLLARENRMEESLESMRYCFSGGEIDARVLEKLKNAAGGK